EETAENTADVTTDQAEAKNTQNLSGDNSAAAENQEAENGNLSATPEVTETPDGSAAAETADTADTGTSETADTSAEVVPTLDFSEDSVMLWPVSGEVLIDYSMDATTYFTTLDQYKYNDALVLQSSVGEPVQAAANGKVTAVFNNEETGTTLTMDLGNGYQAVYGQLKDLTVSEGQTVAAGTILGYVNDPTKYYVKEGANLYFAMEKDGQAIDPMIYIETVTE
ncbi:MAG: peptidoglycan DD-metalloendopeptidase family protein, partial [Oliverpabstia sp.]